MSPMLILSLFITSATRVILMLPYKSYLTWNVLKANFNKLLMKIITLMD